MLNKKVCTLVLLPWLKIGEDLQLGNYRFLRWPRGDSEIDPRFNKSLNDISSMYKYVNGRVESPQTIMIDSSRECFIRIEGEERRPYVEAAVLLTMCLIGENQYFSRGNYINSSLTEVHFQNFSLGEDFVAFTSQKRNGSVSDMGYKFKEITITTPPGCRVHTGCSSLSSEWLESLGSVLSKNTHLDRLIIEASDLFGQANTDSPNVLISTEIVAMANAFDRLFPKYDGRYKLSEKVSKILDRWQAVSTRNSNRLSEKGVDFSKIDRRVNDDWKLIRYWMYELYCFRNYYVHGNDLSRHKWSWDANEHLLMGSYIFPLLIKVLLANEGKYELTEEDEFKLVTIDDLLDLPKYYDRSTRKSLWRETIRKERINFRYRSIN